MEPLTDKGRPRFEALVLISIFGLTLALNAWIAFQLHGLGALAINDQLFDSDAGDRLRFFAGYIGPAPRAYPMAFPIINTIVGAVAGLASLVGIGGQDQEVLRTNIALMVVPFASAIKAVLIYKLAGLIGLKRGACLLLVAAYVAWFSNLAFGSIPDTYGFVSLPLLVFLTLALRSIRAGKDRPLWVWIVAGSFTSILITNSITAGLILFTTLTALHGNWKFALGRTAVAGVCMVLLCVGAASMVGMLHPRSTDPTGRAADQETALSDPNASVPSSGNRITRWLFKYDPKDRIVRDIPQAFASSLILPRLVTGETVPDHPTVPAVHAAFKIEDATTIVLPIVAWIFILMGTVEWLRGTRNQRLYALISLLVMAYCWAFFTVWGGHDVLLYSQNWLAALTILVAGNLRSGSKLRYAAFAGFVLLTVIVNSQRVVDLFDAFRPTS